MYLLFKSVEVAVDQGNDYLKMLISDRVSANRALLINRFRAYAQSTYPNKKDILKQLAVSQCIKTRDIKEAKMPKLIRKVQQNFLKYLSGDHGIFLSNHLYLKEKHESARKIH